MWTQVQASKTKLRLKISFIAELIKIQHKAEQSKVWNTRTYSMFENHDKEANWGFKYTHKVISDRGHTWGKEAQVSRI